MWKTILRDYDERHCCNCDDQIDWFRSQPSLGQAIDIAARAINRHGRRYSHQYRIRRQAIAEAKAALMAAQHELARARSFDAVHDIVTQQLREVDGVGELYRYDTSFRIGVYLGVFPTRVYLHAGTRAGARALGLDCSKPALEMSELPVPLHRRKPHEVEDILCIFKDRFDGSTRVPRRKPRC